MTYSRKRQLVKLILVGGLLGTFRAWATDAVLTADTWISSANPASNYGALPSVSVGPAASALLRFDISTLPAGTTAANIVKATLAVYVSSVSSPGAVDAAVVNSAWTESAVTFSGAPATTTTGGGGVMVTEAGQYLVFDVTSAVRNWVNAPSTAFGFALSPDPATPAVALSFDSKENTGTSHPARLIIEFAATGPQGPAGPQGPPGPQGLPGLTGPAGPAGVSQLASQFGVNTNQARAATGATCTIGEVILSAGTRANAVPANGQPLLIASYQALFSVIGWLYSPAQTPSIFYVPDLRAAAPSGLTYSICVNGIFPSRL